MDRKRATVGVVLPTRNESRDVAEVIERIGAAMAQIDCDWHLVMVDDSDDETPAIGEALALAGLPVLVIHREIGRRDGGLAGAIALGLSGTDAEVVAVLDADLQHPPEVLVDLLPPVLSGSADVAVGSRYCPGGSAEGLDGTWRRVVSKASRTVVHTLFPPTRRSTDPGSGLFAFSRTVIDGVELRPEGFKMLVEILVRGRWESLHEVPYAFAGRMHGSSKATFREGVRFLHHVGRLWQERPGSKAAARAVRAAPARPAATARSGDGLRILTVCSEAPPICSGMARTVSRVVDGLRERGHHVDVLSSADVRRLTVREFRLNSMPLRWLSLHRETQGYDVVHVHGPAPCISDSFFARVRVSRRRPPPIVYTHHMFVELVGMPRASALYNAVHRNLAETADQIIVTTQSYARSIEGPGRPLPAVIPWGVDLERFAGRRWEPYRGHRPLRVLFVGQLRSYKGVDVLIDACAGRSELAVTIIGNGPRERDLRARAARRRATNVRFVTDAPDDAVTDAYLDNDVIVLPSVNRLEAFGLVLLEGMAAGCVPVASDLLGVRDVAGTTGCLVPSGDVAGLRAALLELAADPESVAERQLLSSSRARSYAWEHVIDRYETLFWNLCRVTPASGDDIVDLREPRMTPSGV